MRATAPYAVIGIGVIVMGLIAWWFGFREDKAPEEPVPTAPSIEVSEGTAIYTNGEYGFLLVYPEGAETAETFENPWLPNSWSYTASPESVGTPVVSITTYRIEQEAAYPRHYTTLVRIGASTDRKEVSSCEDLRKDSGEMQLPDRVIGDTTFKAFSFEDAAMMRYVQGKSYRVERDGTCYAIEAIRAGSSYREEASGSDMPQEALDAEYARLDSIVDSFRFAR